MKSNALRFAKDARMANSRELGSFFIGSGDIRDAPRAPEDRTVSELVSFTQADDNADVSTFSLDSPLHGTYERESAPGSAFRSGDPRKLGMQITPPTQVGRNFHFPAAAVDDYDWASSIRRGLFSGAVSPRVLLQQVMEFLSLSEAPPNTEIPVSLDECFDLFGLIRIDNSSDSSSLGMLWTSYLGLPPYRDHTNAVDAREGSRGAALCTGMSAKSTNPQDSSATVAKGATSAPKTGGSTLKPTTHTVARSWVKMEGMSKS
ncbi:hypothetical protein B0H63DRAFT_529643 [Podospora didyma]|uniref:Uncharacterized protein n=1 Tax=Podospora didyma TaxID=330526 RepID=A0AAE0K0Q8_9PEZI|nr:hypothetical protein B0H63DRAFT_529643 [Podospora didyma]